MRRSGQTDHPSADGERLLSYGTLQIPDVLDILLGRQPRQTPATIHGWRVVALNNRPYPVLVPGTGSDHVTGLVFTDLTDDEWATVDAFEDPVYDLHEIPVADAPPAWAYASTSSPTATTHPWALETFVETELPAYLRSCRQWRARHSGISAR